jgi:hypothetical protein
LQWLRSSFYRKEKILKEFYLPENNESPTKNWPEKREIKITGKHPIFYGIFWIVVIFSSLYFYSWFRWLVVVMIITCIAVRTFNGFDSVELALHGDMVLREAISMSYDKKEKGKEKEQEEEQDKEIEKEKETENVAGNVVREVREHLVNKKED